MSEGYNAKGINDASALDDGDIGNVDVDVVVG